LAWYAESEIQHSRQPCYPLDAGESDRGGALLHTGLRHDAVTAPFVLDCVMPRVNEYLRQRLLPTLSRGDESDVPGAGAGRNGIDWQGAVRVQIKFAGRRYNWVLDSPAHMIRSQ
jgi:hypothetical protein